MVGGQVELSFTGIGDKNGVLHWLGTDGGKKPWKNPAGDGHDDAPVEVLASSCDQGGLRMITDWNFSDQSYCSNNVPNSWVAVDLRFYELNPVVYSMAHSARRRDMFLRSWTLQGSHDGHYYEDVDVRNNDTALSQEAPWVAYAAPHTTTYYRFLRILMKPHGNTSNNHILNLNCLEFYGKLRPVKSSAKIQSAFVEPQRERQQYQHRGSNNNNNNSNNNNNNNNNNNSSNNNGTKSVRSHWGNTTSTLESPSSSQSPSQSQQASADDDERWGLFRKGQLGKGVKGELPASAFGQWSRGRGKKGGGGGGGKGRGAMLTGGGRGKSGFKQFTQQEPQEELPCSIPQGTTEFPFSETNGIVFYLSCDKGASTWANAFMSGAIAVTSSSIQRGQRSMVVDHSFSDQVFFTKNEPNSWVQISFKEHTIVPTGYRFSQRAVVKDFFPREWTFEGSNDGEQFTVISTHAEDTSFSSSNPTADFAVSCSTPYNTFRIVLKPNGNSHSTSALVVSCFEIFGTLS